MKQLDLTPLVDEIAGLETVKDGFNTFVDKVITEFEQHKNDPTAVQAVVDRVRTLRSDFGAALVKGTAAVDEAPPVVVDPPVVTDPPVVVDPGTDPTTDPGTGRNR